MRIVGKGCILVGAEGDCPPLPFVTVDETEGRALIGSGAALLYTGDAAELAESERRAAEWAESERLAAEQARADLAARAAADAEAAAQAEAQRVVDEAEAKRIADEEAEAAERARLAAEQADQAGSEGQGGEGGSTETGETTERKQTIADALELLEADHFVKTGDRAGKPKLTAMKEITGLDDLTVDEIDAVVTAKAAE